MLPYPLQNQYLPQKGQIFKILLPVVVTLFLGLLGAAFTWAKDLNAGARRTRFLDEALRGVQFWDSWIKALQQVKEVSLEEKQAVEWELRRCVLIARIGIRDRRPLDQWTPDEFEVYKSCLSPWRRVLLIQAAEQIGAADEEMGDCFIA